MIFIVCLFIASCNDVEQDIPVIDTAVSETENVNPVTETVVSKAETTESTSREQGIGGSFKCPHTWSFHSFSGMLIDGLGIDWDTLVAWSDEKVAFSSTQTNLPCEYFHSNIYEFLFDFNIPRDKLEELNHTTNLYYVEDYNSDILYSGDYNIINEYYINDPNAKYNQRKSIELGIKNDIITYVGRDEYKKWLTELDIPTSPKYYDVQWSIAEAVYRFDISQEALYKMIDLYDPEVVFEYDIDAIYNNKESILNNGVTGYLLDELLRID